LHCTRLTLIPLKCDLNSCLIFDILPKNSTFNAAEQKQQEIGTQNGYVLSYQLHVDPTHLVNFLRGLWLVVGIRVSIAVMMQIGLRLKQFDKFI